MKRLGTRAFLLLTLSLSSASLALSAVNAFSDVPSNAWYADSVESLAEKNILQGSGGQFRPDDPVNRAEMAVMLDRTIQYMENGEVELEKTMSNLELAVPFTSQAPAGQWVMPFSEACEETSLLMVNAFLKGEALTDTNEQVRALADWTEEQGYGIDVGVEEAAQIAEDYYGLKTTIHTGDDVTKEQIQSYLKAGYPVVVPVAGKLLNNPYFTGDGPPYHMIVLVGFNEEGFIAHDPGTQFGDSYVYSYDTMENAIHDWTGSKSTAEEGNKAMLVLSLD